MRTQSHCIAIYPIGLMPGSPAWFFADARIAPVNRASVEDAEASSTPAHSHAPQPSAGVAAVSFMDDGGVSSILAENARGER